MVRPRSPLGDLGFGGEESAGASLLRCDGTVWTTEKDGMILGLLAAEITAVLGKDPGEICRELTARDGELVYERVDAPAPPGAEGAPRQALPHGVSSKDLAGAPITTVLTKAAVNMAAIVD